VDTFEEEALAGIEAAKTNIANIQKELAGVEAQMARFYSVSKSVVRMQPAKMNAAVKILMVLFFIP
jgi:hypothetical protein